MIVILKIKIWSAKHMVVIFELGPEGRLLAEKCRPPIFIFRLTLLAGHDSIDLILFFVIVLPNDEGSFTHSAVADMISVVHALTSL